MTRRPAGSLCALGLLAVLTLAARLPAAAGARPAVSKSIAGLPVVRIPAGRIAPLYPPAPGVTKIAVGAFLLMARPVTNADFLGFVQRTPSYRRDRIARVLAEPQYLSHWAGPLELGPNARPAQPVAYVSWFAARAFCREAGMRLPREAEWELAAAASETRRDASKDPAHREAILRWYGEPRGTLPDVPHGPANVYGVHDLHGVIWEWVEDFNSAMVAADTREQGESQRERFCGAGAALASGDGEDYAAFMRAAQRSSLEAHYTGALLGFRCAADLQPERGAEP